MGFKKRLRNSKILLHDGREIWICETHSKIIQGRLDMKNSRQIAIELGMAYKTVKFNITDLLKITGFPRMEPLLVSILTKRIGDLNSTLCAGFQNAPLQNGP